MGAGGCRGSFRPGPPSQSGATSRPKAACTTAQDVGRTCSQSSAGRVAAVPSSQGPGPPAACLVLSAPGLTHFRPEHAGPLRHSTRRHETSHASGSIPTPQSLRATQGQAGPQQVTWEPEQGESVSLSAPLPRPQQRPPMAAQANDWRRHPPPSGPSAFPASAPWSRVLTTVSSTGLAEETCRPQVAQ